jgi:hypothetical protein
MSIKDITNKNKQKYLTPIAMLSLLVLSIFLQSLTTLTKQASATDGLSISTNKGSILGNETIDITSEANLFEGKTISQISAGSDHSLALDSEGQIYAWGSNYYGQLGNGDTTSSNTPVKVDTSGVLAGKTISQISAAAVSDYSLALDSEGQIYAWGYNLNGQLGNGTTITSNTPVQTNFSNMLDRSITSIKFGDVEAISFNVIDGKTIKAITPPHTAGKVDITITDNEGKTWTILQGYEYMGEKQEEENNDNSQNNTDQNTISPEDITAPNTGRGI